MKAAQLKELTEEELLAKFRHFKEELFNLRFQLATGQLDNTARISKVKRSIAQVLTFLRVHEINRELEVTPEAVEKKTSLQPVKIRYRRDRKAAAKRQEAAIARARAAKAEAAAEALRLAREEVARAESQIDEADAAVVTAEAMAAPAVAASVMVNEAPANETNDAPMAASEQATAETEDRDS